MIKCNKCQRDFKDDRGLSVHVSTTHGAVVIGRPTVLDAEVVRKIEEIAALDGTIEEMALFVGVHRSTVYRWIEESKELKDRIETLRNRPVLLARRRAVEGITESYQNAMDYLKRKRRDEMGDQPEQVAPQTVNVYNLSQGEQQVAVQAFANLGLQLDEQDTDPSKHIAEKPSLTSEV